MAELGFRFKPGMIRRKHFLKKLTKKILIYINNKINKQL